MRYCSVRGFVNTHLDTASPATRLLADELEASLRDLLTAVDTPPVLGPRGPGRPPVLPAAMLWLGFLLCVLRGLTSQRAVWRLLAFHGFWGHSAIPITEQAVYARLAAAPATALAEVFQRLTLLLRARYDAVADLHCAPFASEIWAFDHCVLDPVLRKLKLWREVPAGAPTLIPGRLATLFDLRRQLYVHVRLEPEAQRNVKFGIDWIWDHLPARTLLLFDLGYFAFAWFDQLTDRGLYFISRLREKTSWKHYHLLYEGSQGGVTLRESLVYLGAYPADRAAHPVRLIEVTFRARTYRYLTNVLAPSQLPAAQVVQLYARRWDIEQSFNLLKTHLHLYLLWSGRQSVVWLQVYATLILAQVVLAFRNDLAARTGAALREISLPLLLECVPQLVKDGRDPLAELAQHGRRLKIIRPFRGQDYVVPTPPPEAYSAPEKPPPPRKARYAGKDNGPDRPPRPTPSKAPRRRSKGRSAHQQRRPR